MVVCLVARKPGSHSFPPKVSRECKLSFASLFLDEKLSKMVISFLPSASFKSERWRLFASLLDEAYEMDVGLVGVSPVTYNKVYHVLELLTCSSTSKNIRLWASLIPVGCWTGEDTKGEWILSSVLSSGLPCCFWIGLLTCVHLQCLYPHQIIWLLS